MSKDENKLPIDLALDAVEWEEVPVLPAHQAEDLGMPYVTHTGVLRFAQFTLRVSQLSDGRRVINVEDLRRWFDESGELR